jgi:hypothetical protein
VLSGYLGVHLRLGEVWQDVDYRRVRVLRP